MSIPDELQNLMALKTLRIKQCPQLENRCRKDSGEDWYKVSHILNIHIIPPSEQSLDSRQISSGNGWGLLQKLKRC